MVSPEADCRHVVAPELVGGTHLSSTVLHCRILSFVSEDGLWGCHWGYRRILGRWFIHLYSSMSSTVAFSALSMRMAYDAAIEDTVASLGDDSFTSTLACLSLKIDDAVWSRLQTEVSYGETVLRLRQYLQKLVLGRIHYCVLWDIHSELRWVWVRGRLNMVCCCVASNRIEHEVTLERAVSFC